jgi:hypothetical protein
MIKEPIFVYYINIGRTYLASLPELPPLPFPLVEGTVYLPTDQNEIKKLKKEYLAARKEEVTPAEREKYAQAAKKVSYIEDAKKRGKKVFTTNLVDSLPGSIFRSICCLS